MKEQIKEVDWIVKMRNKNIYLELKWSERFILQQEEKRGGGRRLQERERSATFALPARHSASTADIYILTVGLFYGGLSEYIFG